MSYNVLRNSQGSSFMENIDKSDMSHSQNELSRTVVSVSVNQLMFFFIDMLIYTMLFVRETISWRGEGVGDDGVDSH